jgi:hypothetical protein
MSDRYLESILVPRLRQKLLALYMVCDLDDAKLGRLFATKDKPGGITGRAIRHWVEEDISDRDHVPAERFPQLTEIFRERMPHGRTAEEARALLLSPSHEGILFALLPGVPPTDWLTLVLGAEASTAEVIRAGRDGHRATIREDRLESLRGGCEVAVAVGQQFRLGLSIPHDGWLSIVQWGKSGWLGLELADRKAMLQLKAGEHLLPPVPPYLKDTEVGIRRYILMHSQQPLPPDLASTLLNSALPVAPLSSDTLVRLAHFVGANQVDLKALDIDFTEGEGLDR